MHPTQQPRQPPLDVSYLRIHHDRNQGTAWFRSAGVTSKHPTAGIKVSETERTEAVRDVTWAEHRRELFGFFPHTATDVVDQSVYPEKALGPTDVMKETHLYKWRALNVRTQSR